MKCYKKYVLIALILLMPLVLLGLIKPHKVNAALPKMSVAFYIELPDGTKEPVELKGLQTSALLAAKKDNQIKESDGNCDYSKNTESEWDSYIRNEEQFQCVTPVSCYNWTEIVPYFPRGFNSDQDKAYGTYTHKHFYGETFTERFPWFPFENDNPRGSSDSYWEASGKSFCWGGAAAWHGNKNNECSNTLQLGTRNVHRPSRRAWYSKNTVGNWEGIINGDNRVVWYGKNTGNRPSGMPANVSEIVIDNAGGNFGHGHIDWVLKTDIKEPLTISGEVYCTDDGGETKYPIQEAEVGLYKDGLKETEKMTTNNNGNYSSDEDKTYPENGGFAVRMLDDSNASAVGTDQEVSDMDGPYLSDQGGYCSAETGSKCQCNDGGTGNYEMCGLKAGSNDNFDFVYHNCSKPVVLAPQCVDLDYEYLGPMDGGSVGGAYEFTTNFDDAGISGDVEYEITINCRDEAGNPLSGVSIYEADGGGNTGSGPEFTFTDNDNTTQLSFVLDGTFAACSVVSVPILNGERYASEECETEIEITGQPCEPDLSILKESDVYCIDPDSENPKARIDYTITVSNSGCLPAELDRVVDSPENMESDWLVESSIIPSYGEPRIACPDGESSTCYLGFIEWVLPDGENIVYPDEPLEFKYSVIIPKENFGTYHNEATAYSSDDEYTDDDDVFASCDIPDTGLMDSVIARVGLGIMLLIMGLIYIWSSKFDNVAIKFYQDGVSRLSKDGQLDYVRRKFQEKVINDAKDSSKKD